MVNLTLLLLPAVLYSAVKSGKHRALVLRVWVRVWHFVGKEPNKAGPGCRMSSLLSCGARPAGPHLRGGDGLENEPLFTIYMKREIRPPVYLQEREKSLRITNTQETAALLNEGFIPTITL